MNGSSNGLANVIDLYLVPDVVMLPKFKYMNLEKACFDSWQDLADAILKQYKYNINMALNRTNVQRVHSEVKGGGHPAVAQTPYPQPYNPNTPYHPPTPVQPWPLHYNSNTIYPGTMVPTQSSKIPTLTLNNQDKRSPCFDPIPMT
ncbi:hypothetical protein CR513_23413, partial [Mucuna pruriens]